MPKFYTVEEANALLPELSRLLRAMQLKLQEIEPRRRELERLVRKAHSNGHVPESERLAAEVDQLRREIQRLLDRFTALDVEVKDIQQGLIDFHHLRDGRDVYLCWRLGEKEIAYWHELEAGFAGRQPL